MHEYLVVLPIEDMLAGSAYGPNESLPLHCTLMQWFTLGEKADPDSLADELASLAAAVCEGYIALASGDPALFGPENDVPVHVLVRDSVLDLLHTRLLCSIVEKGGAVKNLKWTGAGFRPHVSTVNGRTFGPGAQHRAQSLVLLQRDAKKNQKVLGSYPFGTMQS